MCLVIPAYNEEKRISHTLGMISESLLRRYGRMKVIVAVQGSDRTMDIVKGLSRKNSRIVPLDCRGTSGKGINLIRGFGAALAARPEIVGFADADASVHPGQLEKMIEALRSDDVQGVIASRYVSGSKIVGHMPMSRWVASRGYNLMVRLLFGLGFSDTQCGAKFFRASALRSIMKKVNLTEMSFDVNLLYEMKMQNLPVEEVPITYYVKNEGSKVRVGRQIPKMFVVTLSYRITRSPFGMLFPVWFRSAVYRWVKSW
ncbi:MAG: glycosyltransferase [Candidatus Micrarchaeota archaeon]|nr:glycosyltransferase [Candidatus Micrarchaeota archaeon]